MTALPALAWLNILIAGGYIVTLDPTVGDLPRGDLLIRNGRIAAIGADLAARSQGAKVVDAVGRLVIPGLVDTHRHVWQAALSGSTGKSSLLGYSASVVGDIAPAYRPEDIYAGTLWGALQALNAGITTVADWSHNLASPAHADANVEALGDSGIRGYFLYGGPGDAETPFFGPDAPGHPEDAQRMLNNSFSQGSHGRLRMGLALRGPAFSSPDVTRSDFEFARALGVPISVHVGMAGFPDSILELDRLSAYDLTWRSPYDLMCRSVSAS